MFGTLRVIFSKIIFLNFLDQQIIKSKIRDDGLVALLILHVFDSNYFYLSSKLQA